MTIKGEAPLLCGKTIRNITYLKVVVAFALAFLLGAPLLSSADPQGSAYSEIYSVETEAQDDEGSPEAEVAPETDIDVGVDTEASLDAEADSSPVHDDEDDVLANIDSRYIEEIEAGLEGSLLANPEIRAGIVRGLEVMAWGSNTSGRTGLGVTGGQTLTPTQIENDFDWIRVEARGSFSVGQRTSGHLYAWGLNQNGQLGLGHFVDTSTPQRVGTASNWVEFAVGASHVLAINSAGELWAWGNNSHGEIGNGTDHHAVGNPRGTGVASPIRIGTASNWTQVSAGTSVSFAVNEDGAMFSWGRNYFGQLALGHTNGQPGLSGLQRFNNPQRVAAAINWDSVSVGNNHGHAITREGRIYSWGSNDNGELGLGLPMVEASRRSSPQRMGTATNWVQVSPNNSSSAAINSAGELWIWGSNRQGQVGVGTSGNDFNTPQRVGTATNWAYVSMGNQHTTAITDEGQLFVWGSNGHGRLGLPDVPAVLGSAGFVTTPTRLGTGSNWLDVSAAVDHTIGVGPYEHRIMSIETSTDLTKVLEVPADMAIPNLNFTFVITPYSFNGATTSEALANLPLVGTQVPPPAAVGIGAIELNVNAANGNPQTLGNTITLTRSVNLLEGVEFDRAGTFVWRITEREGSSGTQLPSQVVYSQAEYILRVMVTESNDVLSAIVLIEEYVADDGTSVPTFALYSWGSNTQGRLGRGSTSPTNSYLQMMVGNRTDWVHASTAGNGSFAVDAQGHLYAWGNPSNAFNMGQGGAGGTAPLTSPTRVAVGEDWVYVGSRNNHVGALTSQGEIFHWGTPNALPHNSVPVQFGNRSDWVRLTVGNHQLFAIDDQGRLFSAGENVNGVLGRAGGNSTEFIQVGTRTDWSHVSVGVSHVIAVTTGGELFSWGNNVNGQLGRATTAPYPTTVPGPVDPSRSWSIVRTSNSSSAAITTDGEIFTWGATTTGQLGRPVDAVTAPANRPAQVGDASDWNILFGGNAHFLAANTSGELWGWGSNSANQLGIPGNYRTVPYFVLRAYNISASAVGGGTHTMMLLRHDPLVFTNVYRYLEDPDPITVRADLTKDLRFVAGTTAPNLNFTFAITPYSYSGNTAHAYRLPAILNTTPATGGLVHRAVSVNAGNSASATAGGITTLSHTIDLLAGVEFDREGTFVWRVSEVPNSSATAAPSNVVYSQAQWELRVVVSLASAGNFQATTTLTRLLDDAGNTASNVAAGKLFTNTYTTASALTLSKVVDGALPNEVMPFTFDVSITPTVLCAPGNITARVYGPPPTNTHIRDEVFAPGTTREVALMHNQRLVFTPLLVGTGFNIAERAHDSYAPSAVLTVGGTVVTGLPTPGPNQPLALGDRVVGPGTNSAAFTNTHHHVPIVGLNITADYAWLPLLVVAVVGGIGFTTRATLRDKTASKFLR